MYRNVSPLAKQKMADLARNDGVYVPRSLTTAYCNTIPPEREAFEKSAPYATAAAANELPCARVIVAIKEYDVPHDREGFYALAEEAAASIRPA